MATGSKVGLHKEVQNPQSASYLLPILPNPNCVIWISQNYNAQKFFFVFKAAMLVLIVFGCVWYARY